MNRETKRMMGRQGQVEADGALVIQPDDAPARRQAKKRTSPAQFVREIRDELRQVAWPTRTEMINYTTVVLATLVLMTALIFGLNYVFGKGILYMFQK
ncbi:MAG TPA: preprotein translocase subunit SecE [Acidimicrobiales bacterium]|nr:preprotein translocase subunit SecE [Acidimicrobiales bacterium]